ncbi:DUF453-domain-containing protein [Ascodesmis nigricans]|uniref:DUF453-domain-containing protein n=1 Tax=Ascodesmis nigricans TaxID=341454 RepID=A0A4V3SJE7_9PEZI|nr:DUF453-domain-containing protein [Ascodesmis nigricans]
MNASPTLLARRSVMPRNIHHLPHHFHPRRIYSASLPTISSLLSSRCISSSSSSQSNTSDSATPATTTASNPIPATFFRGGTSKGIFLNRKHLPSDQSQWAPIFRGIMGSPDPFNRQLNGMGGGISSLSKICVVGPPTDASPSSLPKSADAIDATDNVDVEYTFVQVGVKDGVIDISGNCGNLTTAIGIFALDEGICRVPSAAKGEGNATVKLWNTNTGKTIRTTFPINPATGLADLDKPETSMAGVPGEASKIRLEFLEPAGAKTGKLLPTGRARDVVKLKAGNGKIQQLKISCVDATNPTVFLTLSKLNAILSCRGHPTLPNRPDEFLKASFPDYVLELLEDIRQQAAVLMDLDPNTQAQPKITVFQPNDNGTSEYDLAVKTLSMGILHKAIPSTVALCYAAAVGVKGSVVNQAFECIVNRGGSDMSGEPKQDRIEKNGCGEKLTLELGIPGGIVEIQGRFKKDGGVKSVAMNRTARRLMTGNVFW